MGNILSLGKYRLNNAEFSEIPKFSLRVCVKIVKSLRFMMEIPFGLHLHCLMINYTDLILECLVYDSPEMKPSLNNPEQRF